MLSDETVIALETALPTILSINEVAAFLSCSAITVRRMITDKQLPAFKQEAEWNILRSDLIQYLSDHSNI